MMEHVQDTESQDTERDIQGSSDPLSANLLRKMTPAGPPLQA